MIKQSIIILALNCVVSCAYEEYKTLLALPAILQNTIMKSENESVVFYRSTIYPSHIFGKKKSDQSFIAYMPSCDSKSIKIMEKIDNAYAYREVNPKGQYKEFQFDTTAWERHIQNSFESCEEIFLTGSVQKNKVSDYSVVEK